MAYYDLIGIGNALYDINIEADDHFIQSYDLVKGTMLLVETDIIHNIKSELPKPHNIMPGGSCGNSVALFSNLGGKSAFIGKVASDENGKIYQDSLQSIGVDFLCPPDDSDGASGSCLVLVSPDTQRTMLTSLGVSGDLSVDNIDEQIIKNAKTILLEGYLYDKDCAKEAFEKAANIAHKHQVKIAMSLSDSFCVERHQQDFQKFVENSCDIIFANEKEFLSLYDLETTAQSVEKAQQLNKTICLTLSSKGSKIIHADRVVDIPIYAIGSPIDSTGAGDSFAGGFLYGLHSGLSLTQSGHLASLLAGDIVTHFGPRSYSNYNELIEEKLDFPVSLG